MNLISPCNTPYAPLLQTMEMAFQTQLPSSTAQLSAGKTNLYWPRRMEALGALSLQYDFYFPKPVYTGGLVPNDNFNKLFFETISKPIGLSAMASVIDSYFHDSAERIAKVSCERALAAFVPSDMTMDMVQRTMRLGLISLRSAKIFCGALYNAASTIAFQEDEFRSFDRAYRAIKETLTEDRKENQLGRSAAARLLPQFEKNFADFLKNTAEAHNSDAKFEKNKILSNNAPEFRTALLRNKHVRNSVVARSFEDVTKLPQTEGGFVVVQIGENEHDLRFMSGPREAVEYWSLPGIVQGERIVAAGAYEFGDFGSYKKGPARALRELKLYGADKAYKTTDYDVESSDELPKADKRGLQEAAKLMRAKWNGNYSIIAGMTEYTKR